jgi:signal transduction histidine kinase
VKSTPSRFGRKVNVGLWLAFGLVVVISTLPYLSLRQLRDAAQWRVHTYEVLEAVHRLRSGLQDVESSSRGYVITGRLDFLEPYERGLATIEEASNTVEQLTSDNPKQQQSLSGAREMVRGWLTHIDSTVRLRRESGAESATAKVASGEGRSLMERTRKVLEEMIATERDLLRMREARFEATIRRSGWLTLGASIVALSLVGGAGLISARRLRERNRLLHEHELDTERLQLVNRELEAFSYSVSHDLRGPLRHIDGFVGLLRKRTADQLDEKSQRYLVTIAEAAQQMGRLIDDLLSFSRMGRHEMAYGDVDMAQLFAEARAELTRDAEGRQIVWDVGPLPRVRGDTAMLRLVLVNLVSNALKYTRPRPQAEIRFSSQTLPNDDVQFCISDNGVGFDMKYAGKLFGVFQRLHRAEDFEGTGIGLANVQRILHRHGGRIWAESTPGEGAKFFFTLPLHPSPPTHP